MSLEVRPKGVQCNLHCTYCYQEPMRQAGNVNTSYDIDKILAEVKRMDRDFHLFGGEALLIPERDLETLWSEGFKMFGKNGIQTNGLLINDRHIEMFKKYNVSVGVSIDGMNELNSLREIRGKEGDLQASIDATNKIANNIVKLANNGIPVGIIITLHKKNGTKENLPRLLNFIRWIGDKGVRVGSLHVLEVDDTMPDQDINVLTQEENIEAFLEMAKFFQENQDLQYSPFNDFRNIVTGDDEKVTCFFRKCDPMNTQAVYGIEGDGALTNCSRTNKEGVVWYKADDFGYERYISLYHTPQRLGGCQDCRFWLLCGGSCPGESENGDFRNKTTHCKTMKAMFSHYEKEAMMNDTLPITMHPHRKEIESVVIDILTEGKVPTLKRAKEIAKKRLEGK